MLWKAKILKLGISSVSFTGRGLSFWVVAYDWSSWFLVATLKNNTLLLWVFELLGYLEGMMAVTPSKEAKPGMDSGKYVRYTPEQVEALEKLYHECPKPNSMRRQQVIRECPILSNIEPKQIKVWFQNRRYCGNKFIEDKKNYRRNLV